MKNRLCFVASLFFYVSNGTKPHILLHRPHKINKKIKLVNKLITVTIKKDNNADKQSSVTDDWNWNVIQTTQGKNK